MEQRSTMAQIDAARPLMTSVLAPARAAELAAGPTPEPVARPMPAVPTSSAETLRIPHITIHAFCETPSLISAMEGALTDRRMARASGKVIPGGVASAIDLYHRETS